MDALCKSLLDWYSTCARDLPWRHDPTPYRVWISEIMLQQTRVEAVKEYYRRFLAELPDVRSLAETSEERLFKLWEGLGYYSRARNLHAAAKIIADAGKFPDTPEDLRALPGVGEYTAGAIASIAFGLPEPSVDGNVLRVLSRLLGHTVERQEASAWLRPRYPAGKCSEFTQAWMELGATVCLPNGEPRCPECPLAEFCAALRDGTIAELPAKPPKKARTIQKKSVFLLSCGNQIALIRRPAKGVLAKMWGFPETSSPLTSEDAAKEYLTDSGLTVHSCRMLPDSKHIFTHLEWHMKNFHAQVADFPADAEAVTLQDALEQYALPAAYRAIRDAIAGLNGD